MTIQHPTTMQAWRVHELGDPESVMRLDEVDVPKPGPGQSLLKVRATGLNFPDLLVCRGEYQEQPPLPFTPGLEVCGTVVGGPRSGERVAAIASLPHGGLAEYVVVEDADVYSAPRSMPDAKAAVLLGYLTSHVGLHRRAGLRAGETVLVHAGAGGVGSAAIQLAKAANAQVIATAGGAAKAEVCRRLGADFVIDYTFEDFVEVVKRETDSRGVDVVFDDPVGGDVFDGSRRCTAFEGRLVVVGFAGGRIAQAPTNHALVKNYSVVGLHLGLYRRRDPAVLREAFGHLIELWERGLIDPYVGAETHLGEVPAALRDLGERDTVGKVVVRVS